MNYNRYRWCVVFVSSCTNNSNQTPDKLFIKVPDDIEIRNVWLELAKRDPKSLSTKSRLYLCEDHFNLENDMENYIQYKIMGSVKRIRIKPGCVPSRFVSQGDKKRKQSPTPDQQELAYKKKLITPTSEPSKPVCPIEISTSSFHEDSSGDQDSDGDDDGNDDGNDEKESTEESPISGVPSQQIHAGIGCNICKQTIVGFRYVCVECADFDLCGACEALQAHALHYVLRIPRPRPQREVSQIVRRVREEIERDFSQVLPEPELKTEIKVEAGQDPLQGDQDSRPHASNVLEQSMVAIDIVKEEPLDPELEFSAEESVVAAPVVEALPIAVEMPPTKAACKRRADVACALSTARDGGAPHKRHVIKIESGVISVPTLPKKLSTAERQSPPAGGGGAFSFEVFTHNPQPAKVDAAKGKGSGKTVKKKR